MVENVVGLPEVRLDRRRVLEQRRSPLIGIAPNETVEVFEAQTTRPQIKWTGSARHPVGYVVHLPEPRSVVAVLSENFPHGAGTLGHERVVPRIAGRHLGDDTASGSVVIAPGD